MLTDHRCTKYTDCSSCSFYQRDIFKYRLYPKGYVIPQTRCMQNMVFFLVLKSASNLNGNLNCSKELEHYAS